MTTENQNEGNPQAPSAGLPNPTFEGGAGQPLTTEPSDLKKVVEDLQKQVRALQGEKDRGVRRAEQKVDDLEDKISRILQLKEAGNDESSIRRELLLDQILESGVIPAKVAGGTAPGGTGGEVNIVEVFNQLGLSTNDPEVIALAGGRFRNPDHFRAAAAELALKKARPTSPSQTVSSAPPGSPTPSQTPETLKADYEAAKSKVRRGDIEAISRLQAEYRKKGLPV